MPPGPSPGPAPGPGGIFVYLCICLYSCLYSLIMCIFMYIVVFLRICVYLCVYLYIYICVNMHYVLEKKRIWPHNRCGIFIFDLFGLMLSNVGIFLYILLYFYCFWCVFIYNFIYLGAFWDFGAEIVYLFLTPPPINP